MDEISLSNFRCFHEEQAVRLAPLTLLVGENSTGKTSFMALIRILWDIACQDRVPDFKKDPYDLGSFDEIAHHRRKKGGRAIEFSAGFTASPRPRPGRSLGKRAQELAPLEFKSTFRKQGTAPFPTMVRLSRETTWIEYHFEKQDVRYRFGTGRGAWETVIEDFYARYSLDRLGPIMPFRTADYRVLDPQFQSVIELTNIHGQKKPKDEDYKEVKRLRIDARKKYFPDFDVYASAPVRSTPRRTYDPASVKSDPEGGHVPMYLASIFQEDFDEWKKLKDQLERFGETAGLFDEISIRSLGNRDGEPFQLQVRKFSGRLKGPERNLIDVGYGVSQALPVVTELLRKDCSSLFLFQQPEVHLHPSAQAALGTLFCKLAGPNRQLIVETHSDHLLDRVRMDIRDRTSKLSPDDVSILFFERNHPDVRIHSLRLDENGNVLDAPDTYRQFFLEETARLLGT